MSKNDDLKTTGFMTTRDETTEISILPFLYSAKNIPEALKMYELALRKTNLIQNMFHANKIAEFRNIIADKKFVSTIQKLFDQVSKYIIKRYPDLKFYMEGRRKSVISTEKKILLYLNKNKPLEELRDLLAFRIILFGDNSIELIKSCYLLMENIIDLMMYQGYTPCEATRVFETEGFSNEKLNLLVPKEPLLKENYVRFVKDYIIHPKKSGYQSIHVVFKDSVGRQFEVQIRTIEMHIHAESSSTAGHSFYKENRYSKTKIDLDRTKIHLDGYGYYEKEKKIFDYIGLEEPITILQRRRVF